MMQIELACDIPSRLRKALFTAGPREIGGVLLAEQLEPGHFRVIDFSLDARSGSHTQFRRDPDVHKKTIDDFFERTGHDFSGSITLANGIRTHLSPSSPGSRISKQWSNLLNITGQKSILRFC